ncbi:MAG: nucleoside triphosphate pyrophosphohydrolase family protein [Magnetococcus sp. WYHC-3]
MNYREEVKRTANADKDAVIERFSKSPFLLNAASGLAGESGEFCDLVKKHVFHGATLDRDKVIKELGDIRWYLEQAAYLMDVSMEEIERLNVEKLRKRYPEGFNTQASIERKDVNGEEA